jgi:hypothetical protein
MNHETKSTKKPNTKIKPYITDCKNKYTYRVEHKQESKGLLFWPPRS